MKLKSFRIMNYKSILDSNACYLNKDLTIFAGKNESGKTNILKALWVFHQGYEFKNTDYPNRDMSLQMEMFYEYVLTKEELSELDIELKGILKRFEINNDIIKYKIDSRHQIQLIEEEIIKEIQEAIKNNNGKIEKDINKFLKSLKLNIEISLEDINNIKDTIFDLVENNEASEIYEKINGYIAEKEELILRFDEEAVKKKILIFKPRFIYFDNFGFLIPDNISAKNLDKKDKDYIIVNRLFNYLQIDKEKIFYDASQLSQEQIRQKDLERKDYICELEKTISDDLLKKYTQKAIRMKFDINPLGELSIRIHDVDEALAIAQGDLSYSLSDRSEGFKWFLSFYVTLKGEDFKSNDILLIDEPGLYLHAKAQVDMLKVLLEESLTKQVFFTTHSPYLIDVNNLSRIRIVEKDKTKLKRANFYETKIISSIMKGANNETLTPIADAIGYNLNLGLSLNPEKMVIVEGPSDYYYIIKMANILDKSLNFGLIPAGGADKISNICSVLIGFKTKNIVCLYDSDNKGKTTKKNNEEKLNIDGINHTFLSQEPNIEIEDLFSIDDFKNHVFENPGNLKNSVLMKNQNKTLAAKIFSGKDLLKENLSADTVNSFTNLINLLNNY